MDHVLLKQRRVDPYVVGSVMVRKDELVRFKHALHIGYSGLNALELAFARSLDNTGLTWCRNPSRSGYGIPLISIGSTKSFFPDFLVWKDKNVYAIDTTGGHLLAEKTGRKLLDIEPAKDRSGRLVIRFVSEGRWNPQLQQEDKAGYTVWGLMSQAGFDGDLETRIPTWKKGTPKPCHDRRSTPMSCSIAVPGWSPTPAAPSPT
jgi:type III restriction enzyme